MKQYFFIKKLGNHVVTIPAMVGAIGLGTLLLLPSFWSMALAAHSIPGQVPNVQPLQPPPSFAKPDVAHNVQSTSNPTATGSANPGEGEPATPTLNDGPSATAATDQAASNVGTSNAGTTPVSARRRNYAALLAGVLLALLVLGAVGNQLYRRRGNSSV